MNDFQLQIFFEIHCGNLREGPGSFESTNRAFACLNKVPPKPKILDVGCGPGQQTIDLTKITDGTIISVDNHQPFVDSLTNKVESEDLENRVTVLNKDMLNLDFELNSFDLIWSEGAIYNIGFEKGLRLWKPILKQNGYIAVTEISWLKQNLPSELSEFWKNECPQMQLVNENIKIINNCGYNLVDHFTLPERDWWNYYNPINIKLEHIIEKYKNNPDALEVINLEYQEIELYRNYCDYYGYEFYILQKY